ncbi:sulfotransferase 1B1-like [Glandiceps talaboti]
MVDTVTIINSGLKLSLGKIRDFEVRPDDIFLITYAKSGTTWIKEIVPLVLNGGDIDSIKDVPPDVRVPYLEFALSADDDACCRRVQRDFLVPDDFDLNQLKSPRIFVTHLRQEFLPQVIQEMNVKIIYVARNPKDIAVSCYYFIQLMLKQSLLGPKNTPYESFGEYFADFLECKERTQGVVYDGSQWNKHVLSWWNRRHDKNVLFLKYEDMFMDLHGSIEQITNFLDVKLTDDVTDRIAHHCSFKSMKTNKMALKANYCTNAVKVSPEEKSPFVRKGGVGGWKNYLTVAQNELFDQVYQDWMKDSDLEMTFIV